MENELFEKTPVPKAYLKLAIPLMLANALMLVYNMVDMYFIAKTGNTNLVAGVSLCSPVFMLLIAMGDVFGLGGAAAISQLFGQKRTGDGKRLSVFCFWGAIGLGLLIAMLLTMGRVPILHLLGADAETMPFASSYYYWIALGAPFIIFSLVPANLLRTEGFATGAMTGSVIGSVVNIVLDPVFIFGLGMGAGGAALATVLGNVCADFFYFWFILRRSKNLSVSIKGFYINGKEIKDIFRIGIPSSITNIMQSIGVMLMNSFLLVYGNDKVAAMGIAQKVTMLVVMMMVAFSFGGQPLYGYLYGAGNKKRLKATIRFAYQLVCGTGIVISLLLFVLAPVMISLFMKDAAIIETGAPMLRAVLCGMPFIGFVMVTTCIFQSTGKAAGALALSAGRQGYIYAVVLFIISHIFGYYGVLFAQPAADAITSILAFVLFQRILGKELKE